MMKFERSVHLDAPATAVWEALWDIPRLARCIPGCEDVRTLEEGRRYAATLVQEVGPFRTRFAVEAEVDEVHQDHRIRLHGGGKDEYTKSQLLGSLRVEVGSAGAGGSLLRLDSQMQIVGRLGSIGRDVVEQRANAVFEEFVRRLSRELGERAGPG